MRPPERSSDLVLGLNLSKENKLSNIQRLYESLEYIEYEIDVLSKARQQILEAIEAEEIISEYNERRKESLGDV